MPRGRPAPTPLRSPGSRLAPLLIILLLVAALAPESRALATGDPVEPPTVQSLSSSSSRHPNLAMARQDADDDLAPLRTVGGVSPSVRGTSEPDIRSQAGSLLAGSDSAWRDLTRSERGTLLDADAEWAAFVDLVAGDDARDDLLFPVFEFAWDLSDGGEFDEDDLHLNQVLLDLPPEKLAPALDNSDREAVAVDSTLILIFDNVVVGRIDHAADAPWAETIPEGEIDQRGLIVAPGAATTSAQAADPSPTRASSTEPDRATAPPHEPKYSANGEEIPTVTLNELPPEAADTIYLILTGGPFPFDRDGVNFGNFEGHLPEAESGYYREYTVITPGLDHRGARRIVTGENDTVFFYTDDHYESFTEVILPNE